MNEPDQTLVMQATAVAIEGRALLLEGDPGVGKSSLALALIESGARLIGDDGVTLSRNDPRPDAVLMASPPPNTRGLIEVRGVGLVTMDVSPPAPVALILSLTGAGAPEPERLPHTLAQRELLGCCVPLLLFCPGAIAPAERARQALIMHGLP
ncbi:MAG: serine kinase [Pseudomonadota bacterium]